MAAQTLVGRAPGGVVHGIREEAGDGGGVSAPRPLVADGAVALRAGGGHPVYLRRGEPFRRKVLGGQVLPHAAKVVGERLHRLHGAAVTRLAANVRVRAVRPRLGGIAYLVAGHACLRGRRELEPGEAAEGGEEAEHEQQEYGPQELHFILFSRITGPPHFPVVTISTSPSPSMSASSTLSPTPMPLSYETTYLAKTGSGPGVKS